MIVVIRDIDDATYNAEYLQSSGVPAIPLAILSFSALELKNEVFDKSYQALIYTSKHAIVENNSLYSLPVWCVGNATGAAAKKAGYKNILVPSDNARSMADVMVHKIKADDGPLLWLSGADIAFDIASYVSSTKLQVKRVINYQMKPISQLPDWFVDLVRTGTITGILVLSKRSFDCFSSLMSSKNIWDYHKKWYLFTFDKIPFGTTDTSSFLGCIKSQTSNIDDLFKHIKDWYSIINKPR
ncbi:MAG: hypothetical protein HOI17_02430 [Alphaproteobacteria bacterium]|nr:hypothetical protein [Alphaproteobacteria bacterium]